jgi:hypothetical protein
MFLLKGLMILMRYIQNETLLTLIVLLAGLIFMKVCSERSEVICCSHFCRDA